MTKFVFEREHLQKLRDAGWGRQRIADLYGCDQTTVRYWLVKFGLDTALAVRRVTDSDIDRAIERQRRVPYGKEYRQ